MEDKILQKSKTPPSKFIKPIILLTRLENNKLDALENIDHICHNALRDIASGKNVIKIPRFDSGTPEEWIIFVDLVQKSLVGQNVTTGPPMYECMERVLKGDNKAKFYHQANLVLFTFIDVTCAICEILRVMLSFNFLQLIMLPVVGSSILL